MGPESVWQLTGPTAGPALMPPAGIRQRIHALGAPIDVDPVPHLAERALDAGFLRSGRVTCGGAGRLLASADGWIAANLARDEDLASVAAWLEVDAPERNPWPVVEEEVASRASDDLIERAALLGLPVAALGEVPPPPTPVAATRVGDGGSLDRPPVVVDLSSLWSGPLCTRVLADRGARVIKVESSRRPDGARRGPRAFFQRLHAGKEFQTIDFAGPELAELVGSADVVVEGSRPRALRQLGILAEDVQPPVWLSITGYGRAVDRVAFGDDAAVGGGLVAWYHGAPYFAADAIADPLTGIAAAAAVTAALSAGGRWMIDAAMAKVSAWVAGDDRSVSWSAH